LEKIKIGLIFFKVKEIAISREKIKKWIGNKEIKKVVFVPGKLINIVIK